MTPIPELLELPVIEDCIVTIDAMGCQTEIAQLAVGPPFVLLRINVSPTDVTSSQEG